MRPEPPPLGYSPETWAFLEGKTMRRVAFLDGTGARKHVQLHVCIEEPRLTSEWVQDSRGNSTTTWAVDGEPMADLDHAVAKLQETTS